MVKIKLLGIFSLIMLVLIPVSIQGADPGQLRLDLETALQMALNYSPDLKAGKLNLEKAELEYQRKKAENLLSQSRYEDLEAEYNLAEARNTYKGLHYNLINQAIQQYTKLYLAQLDLEIKELQSRLEKSKLQVDTALYQLGDLNGIDLLEQENAYLDACFNREMAEDDFKEIRIEFQTLLGLAETASFLLTGLEVPDLWRITEEEAIDLALQNSWEWKLQEKKVNLIETDLKRTELSINTPELERKLKRIARQTAEIESTQKKKEIIGSTRRACFQLKQAMRRMILWQDRLKGYQLLAKIKERYPDLPAIFISARDSDLDKIIGLEKRSDDYLAKPFSPRELVIRTRKLLERVYLSQDRPERVFLYDVYKIDPAKRVVFTKDDMEIELTSKEFNLLLYLLENIQLSLAREQILTTVWGVDYFGTDRVLDVLIRRLRKKLPGLRIETIYGYGYRLVKS